MPFRLAEQVTDELRFETMNRVASIQVGKPREIASDKPWVSGFLKVSVTEPIWLDTTNLAGDGQADLIHHGGPHKAVCVYPSAHYPYWRDTLDLPNLMGGDFGENFTVDDLTERDVCIGDIWTLGEATLEISQPQIVVERSPTTLSITATSVPTHQHRD